MPKHFSQSVILAAGLLLPLAAAAHTGTGAVQGFTAGLLHPLLGFDHLLTMLAVGVWAVYLGGRAAGLLPLSFIGLMTVGAGLGFGGIALPHAESGVTLSVTVLGLALWRGWHLPVWLAGTMTAGFAVFHGYVHAAEADTVGGQSLAYLQGFLCTTAVLHVIGMGLGQLTRSVAPGRQLFGLVCTGTGLYWLLQAA